MPSLSLIFNFMLRSVSLKLWRILICSFILLSAIVALWPNKFNECFARIRPGATKREVVSYVGQPNERFTNVLVLLEFGGNEAWAYPSRSGVSITFKNLIQGRLFSGGFFRATSNDYVIVFNDNGIVMRTRKPF